MSLVGVVAYGGGWCRCLWWRWHSLIFHAVHLFCCIYRNCVAVVAAAVAVALMLLLLLLLLLLLSLLFKSLLLLLFKITAMVEFADAHVRILPEIPFQFEFQICTLLLLLFLLLLLLLSSLLSLSCVDVAAVDAAVSIIACAANDVAVVAPSASIPSMCAVLLPFSFFRYCHCRYQQWPSLQRLLLLIVANYCWCRRKCCFAQLS